MTIASGRTKDEHGMVRDKLHHKRKYSVRVSTFVADFNLSIVDGLYLACVFLYFIYKFVEFEVLGEGNGSEVGRK